VKSEHFLEVKTEHAKRGYPTQAIEQRQAFGRARLGSGHVHCAT
jgi:hypothetical protein